MKKLLFIVMTFGLMIIPLLVHADCEQTGTVDIQLEQTAAKARPVSQQLVPEGHFRLNLVSAPRPGTPKREGQAGDMLMGVGIAPRNGWIADYPISPIIIAQVPKREPQVLKEQVLKEQVLKEQVLTEPKREPQVLKEQVLKEPVREPKPVPQKKPSKLLLGASEKIRRLKLFLRKIL